MITGKVTDIGGAPLEGVCVELKAENFETVRQTLTAADGTFSFSAEDRVYPFLTAVRDYTVNYLEYWCQNVNAASDMDLPIRIGTLEVYGLHVFRVKGAYKSLMAYFRPMSLTRFHRGTNIPLGEVCPDLARMEAFVDGHPARVLAVNRVKEAIGAEDAMGAYLIQIEADTDHAAWKRVDLTVWDEEGGVGAASVFRGEQ